MKKVNYFAVSFVAVFCVIFVSCQKETMYLTSSPNGSVTTEVISVNSAMSIMDSLMELSVNIEEDLSRGTAIEQLEVSIEKEQKIAAALHPLTDCGQQLRTNLLIAASDPDNEFELSSDEIQLLENLNDAELAQMMLIILTASDDDVLLDDDTAMKISTGKAKDCLWEAFGINDAIAIWNTLATDKGIKIAKLLTLPKGKMLKLLSKIVGKANYIMLAYTVAEFAYCMLSEDAYKVSVIDGKEVVEIQYAGMAEVFDGEVFKGPVILQVTND